MELLTEHSLPKLEANSSDPVVVTFERRNVFLF